MELSIPPVLVYAASWLTITGGVWVLFERAETVASDEAKAAVSRWLRNLDPAGTLANWPATFAAVFDYVFGERHLSWKCFRRSCLASIISVAIMTLIWASLRPQEVSLFTEDLTSGVLLVLTLLILTAIINLITDYVSLLETRYVIRWMSIGHLKFRVLSLLALDFVATSALALGIVFLFASQLPRTEVTVDGRSISPGAFPEFPEFVVESVLPLKAEGGATLSTGVTVNVYFPKSAIESGAGKTISAKEERPPAQEIPLSPPPSMPMQKMVHVQFYEVPWGVFFYSTYFTSVWVWLYALAGLALKLAQYLDIGLTHMKRVLDIENKPLRSLGFVSMLLVTIVYLVIPFVR